MNINTLKGALPIAARLLAQKCGLVVRFGGQACTNGREITLPNLPIEVETARILGLGFILHEGAGHVVETDFEGVQALNLPPFVFRLFNALEDVRIEGRVERRYPGAHRVFMAMRKLLQEQGRLADISNVDSLSGALVIGTLQILQWRVLKREFYKESEATAVEWLRNGFGIAFADSYLAIVGKLKTSCSSVEAAHIALEAAALLQQFVDDLAESTSQPDESGSENESADASSVPGQQSEDDPQGDESDASPTGTNDSDAAAGDSTQSSATSPSGEQDTAESGQPQQAESGPEGIEAGTQVPAESGGESHVNGEKDTAGGDTESSHAGEPGAVGEGNSSSSECSDIADSESLAGGQDGHDATANGTDATEVDTGGQAEPSFCLADPVTSAALQAALGAAYNPSEDLGEALQAMLTSIASTTEDPPVLSEAVPFLSEIEDNGEIVQRVKRETIALRRKLTTALESQTLSQCWEGYAGERLSNLGALRLPMGDLNIFERETRRTNVDVAIQLLLDRSGSMQEEERIALAIDACTALGLALGQIDGVQIATAAFPAGEINCDRNVLVLNGFSESVSRRAGRIAAVRADGANTPLADAMLFGQYSLLSTKATRRILLPITDGEPDSRSAVAEVVASCARWGVEVMGVGIGLDISSQIPDSIRIDKVEELPQRMFEMMTNRLVLKQAA
ncbi:hypothetical protein PQH03_27750 [Ralstonia insidiosa]|jgi:Mg-chelatase subunit ChlD|uniref:VWFA domain-containing protein n=1 Tax=Ralstonia insidiosa TaxID=190721 RepID=A0A192A7Q4_9RALS|nr:MULTISPECIES: hypothetical protein [Ralstonia]KMW44806.1 hypothetical protein AC240_22860 [Ralstonia sp. MD27]ANJ76332.1 hypothetical protein A9Y76_27400 [Ralstonia insidiosa]MBA9869817.1 hypothetical protein [Ralstonia insidiosa]MBA9913475.1 hypothetical protein [Ralstonia insidiosa]MBA9952813.1 hypothetical protein [Ralstonia insidiosa]